MNTLADNVNQQPVDDREAAGTHEDWEAETYHSEIDAETSDAELARRARDYAFSYPGDNISSATREAIYSTHLSHLQARRSALKTDQVIAESRTVNAESIHATQARMLTDALCGLRLREFDQGDRDCWAGAERPVGFECQTAEIKVEGIPPQPTRERGRPVTLYWNPNATLIVDATGVTINFSDTGDQGYARDIRKEIPDFSLAVEVAKVLRPTMKYNVLLALGFEER